VLVGDTGGILNASLLAGGGFTIGRNITVQSGSSGTATLGGNTAAVSTFSGDIALNKSTILTAATGGEAIFSGTISGGFGITKTGDGTVTLSHANTYTGGTTLNQGTLKLGVNDALGTGGFNFAGGILDANNTTDSTIGALTLSGSATLLFHAGSAGSLTFASASWTAGTLTITGWSGVANTAGTDDKLFVTSGSASQDFLDHIFWTDQSITGANQLGTGEIVPVPEPINVALGIFAGAFVAFGIARRLRAARLGEKAEKLKTEN
jgi:autotransporter-associated beta strand protein